MTLLHQDFYSSSWVHSFTFTLLVVALANSIKYHLHNMYSTDNVRTVLLFRNWFKTQMFLVPESDIRLVVIHYSIDAATISGKGSYDWHTARIGGFPKLP